MTSQEALNLFNLKSGRMGDPEHELRYCDLREVMAKLGIQFKSRIYQGYWLTCYLNKQDIHQLADVFGVALYGR